MKSSTSNSTSSSISHSPPTSPSLNQPSDEHDVSVLFEICQTPDRGLGLFASRRIPAGNCVISEEPLISLPLKEEGDPNVVEAAFHTLSKAKRKRYLQLFDAQKSRMSQVVSIYYSNCYSKDGFTNSSSTSSTAESKDAQGDGGSCIGIVSSRINHSCLPNLSFNYLTPSPTHPKGLMQFYAIKNISRGKELLSSYDKSVSELRDRRQQKHMLYYGFTCICDACIPKSSFWERSDDRRRDISNCLKTVSLAERQFEEARQQGRHVGIAIDEAIGALTRMVGLLTKEGLTHKPLANVYRGLAKWSSRKGDRSMERKWIEMEHDCCVTCFGVRSGRVQALKRQISLLDIAA